MKAELVLRMVRELAAFEHLLQNESVRRNENTEDFFWTWSENIVDLRKEFIAAFEWPETIELKTGKENE